MSGSSGSQWAAKAEREREWEREREYWRTRVWGLVERARLEARANRPAEPISRAAQDV